MNRTIRLAAAAAILAATGLLASSIYAQQTAFNYGVFDHVRHDAALSGSGQAPISCDVCHKRDAATSQLYYPGHDACIQCHVPQFTTQSFEICAVCHKDVKTLGRVLLDFPAERKDYGVRFDGAGDKSQHAVHMKEALPNGDKMTCVFCHKSQGTNQAFPSHPECYACHTPGVNSRAATPQRASCAACHPAPGQPYTEMRRLISTRRNDALAYRFRHVDHTRAMGNGCVECHRAEGSVHVISSATREHRARPGFNCVECHRAGGRSRITETSCGSCHGVMIF
jgi:hypothetical protein